LTSTVYIHGARHDRSIDADIGAVSTDKVTSAGGDALEQQASRFKDAGAAQSVGKARARSNGDAIPPRPGRRFDPVEPNRNTGREIPN
jgi:hypothetical protein